MAVHRPFVEPEVESGMQYAAELLHDVLPKNFGFALLVFEMDTDKGYMNYISSAQRDDMLAALKELVANMEGMGMDPPQRRQ